MMASMAIFGLVDTEFRAAFNERLLGKSAREETAVTCVTAVFCCQMFAQAIGTFGLKSLFCNCLKQFL